MEYTKEEILAAEEYAVKFMYDLSGKNLVKIKDDFLAGLTYQKERSFSKEDLWKSWWVSALKVVSFSPIDEAYERRCFDKHFSENYPEYQESKPK